MRRSVFFAAVLALAGCNTTSGTDSGPAPGNDGGNDAFVANTVDAFVAPTVDSGNDAFVATTTDANVDANTNDGGGVCHADYSGCTAATTEEVALSTTPYAISATGSFTYDHHCVRVHAGQQVTITNSSFHPLLASSCSTTGTPLPASQSPDAGGTSTYTFSAVGSYGYHCAVHGQDNGTTMAGLIIVE